MYKLVVFFLLLLSACTMQEGISDTREWLRQNGKIKVLCTTAMIADLAEKIGGEQADVLTLIRGELNPHTYQLVKGDDEKLRFADIIFANGLGLEHGASLHKHLQSNAQTTFLGDRLMQQEPSLIITLNGALDPHIWMDVDMWRRCAALIGEAFAAADAKHAQLYRERAQQVQQSLEQLDKKIESILSSIPQEKRFLVTSHDAFNYFTRRYLSAENEREGEEWRKRFAAPEGLSPDSQLSTADIRHTVDFLFKHRIHVIFPESNVSRDSIHKIVEASASLGLQVRMADAYLYGDAMGGKGSSGETYEKMLLHNVETIARFLNEG